ncbi:unnamed protein product [Brachionus calyciflorus]|uniref:RING-type domain-containing protein n=1 Tax=Brachionus calyciflorus TaxID=104777 RepID=A0A813MXF4_9BILA|nr:unnamed protein product [Brachionus calyciflorus]
MSDENNNLIELEKIFNKIFEQFNCSICLNEFTNTHMSTKCAHRFCENCIKTTVELNHKCPLCNHRLVYEDLVRDNHFDSLKDDLKILKEKKMQAVFDKISSDTQTKSEKIYSPIENVLKNHLIKTLIVHENYTNQLRLNYEKEVKRIEDSSNDIISKLRNIFLTKKDVEAEEEKIKIETQKKLENLKKDFDRQVNSIAERYKKYLEQNELSPLALPVKIKIRLVTKDIRLDGFEFKTNDDISLMLDFIKNKCEELRDPIVEFGEDLKILNVGPFGKYTYEEAMKMFEVFEQTGFLPDSVNLINSKNCIPIIENLIKPDSEFLFFGNIKFESDLPKRCFKYIFNKDKPVSIDYFQCQDCMLKWICKYCVIECHSKHNVRPFSLNHNPTWACCFCERNNCCLGEKESIES